jgi:hypothetical protein
MSVAAAAAEISRLEFGLTILVVGMGGTLVTLGLVTLMIGWLKRWKPPGRPGEEGK